MVSFKENNLGRLLAVYPSWPWRIRIIEMGNIESGDQETKEL
jgi:hypothetical protein